MAVEVYITICQHCKVEIYWPIKMIGRHHPGMNWNLSGIQKLWKKKKWFFYWTKKFKFFDAFHNQIGRSRDSLVRYSGNGFASEKGPSMTCWKKMSYCKPKTPAPRAIAQRRICESWDCMRSVTYGRMKITCMNLFWRELPILKREIPLVWAELMAKMVC